MKPLNWLRLSAATRAPFIGKITRELRIQPGLVDLVGQYDKRVIQVDDLIETGPEQIVAPGLLLLFRSHSVSPKSIP